jgi:hypothetical protein
VDGEPQSGLRVVEARLEICAKIGGDRGHRTSVPRNPTITCRAASRCLSRALAGNLHRTFPCRQVMTPRSPRGHARPGKNVSDHIGG